MGHPQAAIPINDKLLWHVFDMIPVACVGETRELEDLDSRQALADTDRPGNMFRQILHRGSRSVRPRLGKTGIKPAPPIADRGAEGPGLGPQTPCSAAQKRNSDSESRVSVRTYVRRCLLGPIDAAARRTMKANGVVWLSIWRWVVPLSSPASRGTGFPDIAG